MGDGIFRTGLGPSARSPTTWVWADSPCWRIPSDQHSRWPARLPWGPAGSHRDRQRHGPPQLGERFHTGIRAENLYWRLARRQATWLLNPLCRVSGAMVLRSARGDPQRFTQGMSRRLPEADRLTTQRLLARPDAQPALIEDLRESYRQGTTTMAADLLEYTRPWGFRTDQVTTTVHLWHGEQDPKVPIAVARQLAASLSHCHTHIGAGAHLMACDHADEIVTTVTSAFDQDAKRSPANRHHGTEPADTRAELPYSRTSAMSTDSAIRAAPALESGHSL